LLLASCAADVALAAIEPASDAEAAAEEIAPAPSEGEAGEDEGSRPGPSAQPLALERERLDPKVRSLLAAASRVAHSSLASAPACRALFAERAADGQAVLARTRYVQAADEELTVCRERNAAAYTFLWSQRVVLCPGFASLARQKAAVLLIHEGLHQAGMSERPLDPHALESFDIHELVRRRCRL
jgi:hypothetical protein